MRLPNLKLTTINPKDSRYERGTNGGQVIGNLAVYWGARIGRFVSMNFVKSFPFSLPGAKHPDRRLTIVARDSGGFSIVEQYFYRTEDEEGSVIAEGWASLPGLGIFANVDLAEREITAMLRGDAQGQ